MIKFSNYKITRISEIFEGFNILSEEELEDRIQKTRYKRLNVYGGLNLEVDPNLKNFILVSGDILSGTLFSPASTYFSEFDPKDKETRVIHLWFTSPELAKTFIIKFYYKNTPYIGDINRSILIISEQ